MTVMGFWMCHPVGILKLLSFQVSTKESSLRITGQKRCLQHDIFESDIFQHDKPLSFFVSSLGILKLLCFHIKLDLKKSTAWFVL
jgi:hypothetical protein